MNRCVGDVVHLGKTNSCENIHTGIVAVTTGLYTGEIWFNNTFYELTQQIVAGEEITIENRLPENILLHMRLRDPDGKSLETIFTFYNQVTIKI